MELTIVCWLWDGWNPVYGPGDVHRLQRKLEKHMSVPFRFVCITDIPDGLECETFPLWSFPKIDQEERRKILSEYTDKEFKMADCYRRLRLFDPEINKNFGDYVVSIDLDCEIFDDLWPLFENGESFRITKGGPRAPYCGTMFAMKPGENESVWTQFDPATTPNLLQQVLFGGKPIVGSDQAWLSLKFVSAPTWGEDDGVYFLRNLSASSQRLKKPDNCRVVFAPGKLGLRSPECKMFVPWLYKAACSP